MPRESRLCWLDSSVYVHCKIFYMVSPERRESERESERKRE